MMGMGMNFQRESDGMAPAKRARIDEQPSKVLLVRNLPAQAGNQEVMQLLNAFGAVRYVILMPKKGQALVEFTTIDSAAAVMVHVRSSPLFLGENLLQFSFSQHQQLSPHQNQADADQPTGSEKVLLLSIMNPLYSITADVLQQALSPYGTVLRVIVFNKNGVQALVEFDNYMSAQRAKVAVDGKDIYQGCCTIVAHFSKTEKLTVKFNNDRSRDFTNPGLPGNLPQQAPSTLSKPAGLLNNPFNVPMNSGMSGQPFSMPTGMSTGMPAQNSQFAAAMAGMMPASQDRPVVIVGNIPERILPDNIFNLFSIYGNVLRVKMLYKQKGTALIQMGDGVQAQLVIASLNGVQLFGSRLSISLSKFPQVALPRGGGENDGSSELTKDYSAVGGNRLKPNKHTYAPCATLHFYNAPETITEEALTEIVTRHDLEAPVSISFLEKKNAPETTRAPKKLGFMQFSSVEAATAALAFCNNTEVSPNVHLKLHYNKNDNVRPNAGAM
eukprot:TRINITY_DN19150_c0_g1::TRINITY_DN19150_c0_g1_i1::g.2222::m.2222 TRINITY_DN19150_c0_g1::TRINITY_DN19150_c0_g1_i1::g.2222  ORF type:complete len:515 (+),score=105.39,sp/Q8WVV9/HNRLL_HUMAN/31.76/1e-67,RRM_5/PF13893.1/2.3e-05,RRM_5/PF13893.1/7.9e-09,RRM_5/PF13893.1/4.2e-13,RRM_5/PF13893.1/0.2,RRM_6/PF14259.1/4.8e-08,RRM_6/PF14259.1/0.006,RRM_6/PF14259.1/4.1e-11,RRM_6/PF14259.1/0.0056,RRM_1/PF00076.17/1.1e-06,RRM_1/PF00076.17/2.1e-06,RRM_1/PF00076.17/1.3e-08,RRM_1/PF00076.17/0.015,Limkain-b1/PF11608.